MSITFAAQLAKMITAGLGGAMDAPETNVAIGFRFTEKTVSGNPLSFNDGAGGKPVRSLEIAFSPVQSGSGDPAPDNVRPISGWSELELHRADDTEEIPLGDTYYCGTVDVVSGDGSATWGIVDLGTLNWRLNSEHIFGARIAGMATESSYEDRKTGIISTAYPVSSNYAVSPASMDDKSMLRLAGELYIRDTDYSDAAAFKAAMSGVYLCYELATPIPFTVTPQDIVTQEGGNIFITDANGNMTITYTAVGYTEGY